MDQRIKTHLYRMGKAAVVWFAFIGICIHLILFHAALVRVTAGKESGMLDVNMVQIVGNTTFPQGCC